MARVYEDTAKADAHFYLDERGNEITRREFLEELYEGYYAYMIYVGGGYVPLRVAVLTVSHRRYRAGDEGSAIEAFEEWARENRPEEIGEGPEFEKEVQEAIERGEEPPQPEYEASIEEIPEKAGALPAEPANVNQSFEIRPDGTILLDGAVVGHAEDDTEAPIKESKRWRPKLPDFLYTDFMLMREWSDCATREFRLPIAFWARREPGQNQGFLYASLLLDPQKGKRWGLGARLAAEQALAELTSRMLVEKYRAWAVPTGDMPGDLLELRMAAESCEDLIEMIQFMEYRLKGLGLQRLVTSARP